MLTQGVNTKFTVLMSFKFPSGFQPKFCIHFPSHLDVVYIAHFILFNLIILIFFGEA
jgi:hypothetical protein